MATLKDVAQTAKVPLITAYHALNRNATIEDTVRQQVLESARALNYRLNITIRDVADLAKVSTATVSYVLNNSAPVRDITRERVLLAVEQLGYRPNSLARNLKASQTRMLGYAWQDVRPGTTNFVLEQFMFGMAQAAESYGYHVLTFTEPAHEPIKTYEELIQTNRVDGFVVSHTFLDDPRIARLLEMGVPFVCFGQSNPEWDFPFVDVNGAHGTMLVVNHLIENGHTKIGFMGWEAPILAGTLRFDGYCKGLEQNNLSMKSDWLAWSKDNTIEAGVHAAQRVVNLPPQDRPTALVCVSDLMAIGAMRAIENAGLKVGEDIALTGFDDHPMLAHMRPPLTSLQQPIEEVARLVVELLISEVEGRPLMDRQILLEPELIIRESSSRARK